MANGRRSDRRIRICVTPLQSFWKVSPGAGSSRVGAGISSDGAGTSRVGAGSSTIKRTAIGSGSGPDDDHADDCQRRVVAELECAYPFVDGNAASPMATTMASANREPTIAATSTVAYRPGTQASPIGRSALVGGEAWVADAQVRSDSAPARSGSPRPGTTGDPRAGDWTSREMGRRLLPRWARS